MKRRSFIKYTSGCFATGLFSQHVSANDRGNQQKPLVLGIFPRRNPRLTYTLFKPLTDYLSAALNRQVVLQTTRHYSEFWSNIQRHRYDILHYNQYQYILSNMLYGHRAILKNHEYGSASISSAIFTHKDSDIETIQDLKAKSILFGGNKMAMHSYIGNRWLLQNNGLYPEDYVEKFAVNPPNAIIATYQKQADAAATGNAALSLDSVRKNIDITQLKYVAQTQALPHLPWAVSKRVDEELMLQIQNILSQLRSDPSGNMVLDQAKLTALIPVTDSEYNEHRQITRDVYGKNYGAELFS